MKKIALPFVVFLYLFFGVTGAQANGQPTQEHFADGRVPEGYRFDDIRVIAESFGQSKIDKKSEFETQGDFEKRIINFIDSNNKIFVSKIDFRKRIPYNAEKEAFEYTIIPPINSRKNQLILHSEYAKLGTYTAKNGFGASIEVEKEGLTSYSLNSSESIDKKIIIPMSKNIAESKIDDLAKIVLWKVIKSADINSACSVSSSNGVFCYKFSIQEPTFDSPTKTVMASNYINAQIIDIIVYDQKDGRILGRLTQNK